MKKLIFIICLWIGFGSVVSAQVYNPGDYQGTSTVSGLKSKYTLAQIKIMLDSAEIYKNVDTPNTRIGMVLTDVDTLAKILVSDADSTLLMYEYLKKLRTEIEILKQRLQTAGIP